MKKFVLLCGLFILFDGQAQNYIQRTAEEPVYDVEVIVFGHHLAQPSVETVKQAAVYDQQAAVDVDFLPDNEDWPIIKSPPDEPVDRQPAASADSTSSENSNDNAEWQVPLNEEPTEYEVLVWYLKSNQLNSPVVNLLAKNPKFKPLIRQNWRQPATPFNQPLYVKLNSHPEESSDNTEDQEPTLTQQQDFSFIQDDKPAVSDFQINGQVALSQGRFTHLHIKFNYYRINQDNDVVIYASKQQRQINLDEWQYFDHPQFGVLIKVTDIKAEELL
jgi:hypothetical protein